MPCTGYFFPFVNRTTFSSSLVSVVKKIKEKIAEENRSVDYVLKLTECCKAWGGPCCSLEELKCILKKYPDQEKVIKTELAFYVNTNKETTLADRNYSDKPKLIWQHAGEFANTFG